MTAVYEIEYNARVQDFERAKSSGLIIESVKQLFDHQVYQNIVNLIEEGKTVLVKVVAADYNNKLLRSSQNWKEDQKIKNAVHRVNVSTAPTARLLRTDGDGKTKVKLVVTDGNHRLAIDLLEGRSRYVKIVGEFSEEFPHWGFNAVLAPVRNELNTR